MFYLHLKHSGEIRRGKKLAEIDNSLLTLLCLMLSCLFQVMKMCVFIDACGCLSVCAGSGCD